MESIFSSLTLTVALRVGQTQGRTPHSERHGPGVRRWLQWLGERLAPHRVRYEGFSGETDRETRWCIRFYDGPDVILHIPTHLVDGDDHAFEWITLGMESYDWKLVLRQASASYLTLNRNGMIWAMDPDE